MMELIDNISYLPGDDLKQLANGAVSCLESLQTD